MTLNYKKYTLYIFTLIAIFGCGGIEAKITKISTPAPTPIKNDVIDKISLIEVGIFMDSEVSGLGYTCGSNTGETNSKGEFNYTSGDICVFKLGDNVFDIDTKSIDDGIVTPFNITQSDEEAYELARVIQSLSTQNQDGTLSISKEKANKLTKIDLKDKTVTDRAIKATGAKVITVDEAKQHLSKNFNLEAIDKKKKLKTEVKEKLKARLVLKKIQKQEVAKATATAKVNVQIGSGDNISKPIMSAKVTVTIKNGK